mgnify:CR=1 FL=1
MQVEALDIQKIMLAEYGDPCDIHKEFAIVEVSLTKELDAIKAKWWYKLFHKF